MVSIALAVAIAFIRIVCSRTATTGGWVMVRVTLVELRFNALIAAA